MRNGGSDSLHRTLFQPAPAGILVLIVVGALVMGVVDFVGCGPDDVLKSSARSRKAKLIEDIQRLRSRTQLEPANAVAWRDLGEGLLHEAEGKISSWNSEYMRYGDAETWMGAERSIDDAILAFKKGIALDTSDVRLYALAGHALLTKCDHDPILNDTTLRMRAIAFLERAIAIDSSFLDGLVDLGFAWTPSWRFEGDIHAARRYINRAMALRKSSGMVQYALACLEEATADYRDEMATLRKALMRELSDETVYLEIATRYQRAYYALGSERDKVNEQERSFVGKVIGTIAQAVFYTSTPAPKWIEIGAGRRALMAGFNNPLYYFMIADGCRYGFGRDKAADYYGKAFDEDSLAFCKRYVWFDRNSREWLQRYVNRNPGSYYAHIALGDAYWQSYDRRDENDSVLQKTRAEYLAALALRQDIGTAYARLGRTYDDPLKPEKSLEWFQRALTLRFEEGRSLLDAADEFEGAKKFDEAMQCYRRLYELALIPRPMLLWWQGMVRQQKGDTTAAHAAYLELAQSYPAFIYSTWEGRAAASSIGEAYGAKGNYDKAIDILKKSLGNERWQKAFLYDQISPKTCAQIGKMYSKKGDSENAFVYYNKALQVDEEFREAHLGMAEEYATLKMRDKAIESYRTAARLGVPAAKEALKKMGVSAEPDIKR
jgi:tetratricopeptide (TPR) repeat protein